MPGEVLRLALDVLAIQIELLPLMKPISSATEYFGGMETNMWTRSGIKMPHREFSGLGSPYGDSGSPRRSFSATHADVELPIVAPAELEA